MHGLYTLYVIGSWTISYLFCNKKSPRDIRPHHCSPSPKGPKNITVTQDKSSSVLAEVCDQCLFGQVKTGSLGLVTKKKTQKKKMGVTKPHPDGGVMSLFTLPGQGQKVLKMTSYLTSCGMMCFIALINGKENNHVNKECYM